MTPEVPNTQALQQTTTQATSPVYQTTVLTPGMVDTLIIDDSPVVLSDELWQFLGVDIPVADIKEWDFKNVLDMVDLAVINMLEEFPETSWDKVAIVEYETVERPVIDEKTGKPKINKDTNEEITELVAVPKKIYNIVKLWDQLRTKVYLKMCRAREGFTLKQLTETKQVLEEKLHQSGSLTGAEEPKKKRWGIL